MSIASPRPRQRQIAVSFSTRISLSSRDLIDEVVQREGISIREVVEQALEKQWGSGSDSPNGGQG